MTSTITFPTGNLAPEGSVVKSTSIDPSMLQDGVYRHKGPVKVFGSEKAAIDAIKSQRIKKGDIMVLAGCGPTGTGMEETYQVTSALKHLSYGKYITLLTDARFSGVSTGACIGHIGPEALTGGPIGKLYEEDVVDVTIDCVNLTGSIDFVGSVQAPCSPEEGTGILASRRMNPILTEHPDLPDDTRLWAAMQAVSGGTWKGSVYDAEAIISAIDRGTMNE